MSIANRTTQQKLDLANALAKAEALVRRSVQELPVNFLTDIDAAIAAAKTQVDATVAAT
ncbi:hypothetical protein HOR51_gp56 [Ralstonia phage phiAp1]|uniref:Uncharacterized protein n=1 Tax=Ralstonia phage phiAp1 TaxID=2783867 RepID=A0A1L7DS71_9CAUD|nr:hypothetical protein HOR51_gp56 [Ralstonia phage phiAp1]APU03197.1 hypothetical protein phiAp1_56 [Ralstonia phage phiAp1]